MTYLTGYKLRKHIAKALQSRSQAIRSALEKYNAAANTVSPPRPNLTWSEVVEYAFLADFDLLRESRQDIRTRQWATPACRAAMDQFFKIQRAREEIERLNIEIKRVVTYIRDEETYLAKKEAELCKTNPGLGHQVALYRMERGRANDLHLRRFRKLARCEGFSGSIKPGTKIGESGDMMDVDSRDGGRECVGDDGRDGEVNDAVDGTAGVQESDGDSDGEEGERGETDEELAAVVYDFLTIALD